MPDYDPCEICATQAETIPSSFDGVHQACPRCGEFKLSGTAGSMLRQGVGPAVRAKVSGWVRDQNRDNTVPMITSDVLQQVSARPLPSVAERGVRLLLEALRGQERLGAPFDIYEPKFAAATYSLDADEVRFLLSLLSDQGQMEEISSKGTCRVLPRGYIAADELTRRFAQTGKGFVAMWFDEELEPAYEDGFQVGVLNAGYDPVRVDRVEHINRIDDEIIGHIKTASFVVADFTGHRGGVYFEAGFALGIELPVIWCCRKDHLAELHFDIRQYNCIDWETPDELALRLQRRIEATIGKGPKAVLDGSD